MSKVRSAANSLSPVMRTLPAKKAPALTSIDDGDASELIARLLNASEGAAPIQNIGTGSILTELSGIGTTLQALLVAVPEEEET